uniref:Uncharacterized protein n=2 Tax=Lygus hesperus TaxID=30085 RepID=A0A0A9Z6B8_LYGHE
MEPAILILVAFCIPGLESFEADGVKTLDEGGRCFSCLFGGGGPPPPKRWRPIRMRGGCPKRRRGFSPCNQRRPPEYPPQYPYPAPPPGPPPYQPQYPPPYQPPISTTVSTTVPTTSSTTISFTSPTTKTLQWL